MNQNPPDPAGETTPTPRTNTACKRYAKVMENLVVSAARGDPCPQITEDLQALLVDLITTSAALERELIAKAPPTSSEGLREQLLNILREYQGWMQAGDCADRLLALLPAPATGATGDDGKRLEAAELQLEELWIATKGIRPDDGKMWLTPRMARNAAETVRQWNEQDAIAARDRGGRGGSGET